MKRFLEKGRDREGADGSARRRRVAAKRNEEERNRNAPDDFSVVEPSISRSGFAVESTLDQSSEEIDLLNPLDVSVTSVEPVVDLDFLVVRSRGDEMPSSSDDVL